jgi:aminoglycoside phosphotransferase family enzyme/predicted kinase
MSGCSIQVIETHVSWLIIMSDRVYKIKRPVIFPFIDLHDSTARDRACRAEVNLNRRLSPDVYLGVGTFVDPDGAIEPVVVMRRLPEDRSLTSLIERADPALPRCLDEIAVQMASFHRGADRGRQVERDCTSGAVQQLWRRNLAELRAAMNVLPSEMIDQIGQMGENFLAGRNDLFAGRIEKRRAVDGHGDLLAADVFCLDDGPRLLDCLEFDESLRHVDTLLDMASLAAEVERLGRLDLADHLLRRYQRAAGDAWPASLEHFYMAYRALVRAKVACLGDREPTAAATGLLSMAQDHLRAGTVRLVLVGGLPGTGKSTLATGASHATRSTLLRSDVVRRELESVAVISPTAGEFGVGRYEPERTDAVYSELLRRAEPRLRLGDTVILDATWARRSWRDAARQVAVRTRSELIELRCEAPRAVADRRLVERARDTVDPSDATPAVAHTMATVYDDWPESTAVNTAVPVTDTLGAVLDGLGYPPRFRHQPA